MKRNSKECTYCGRKISLSNYSRHLHSCKNKEHKRIYTLDHDDLFCKFCKKEYENKRSLVAHECRCRLNPNRYIQERNGPLPGTVVPWNKGKTKETDERILKGVNTFNKNEKLGLHTNKPKHISKEHIEKIKRSGFGGYTGKHSVEYKGVKLDSSYELKVAKELDDNGVIWEQPKRKLFKYYEYGCLENDYHYYTPDFYLPNYNIYLDPKNDFLINNINPATGYKDIDKICWVEQYNNVKIIILNKDELTWEIIYRKIQEKLTGQAEHE